MGVVECLLGNMRQSGDDLSQSHPDAAIPIETYSSAPVCTFFSPSFLKKNNHNLLLVYIYRPTYIYIHMHIA